MGFGERIGGSVLRQKTKRLCLYLFLVYTGFASSVCAAEKGMIIADQFIGDYEQEQLIARGKVTVTYKDYVITGDEIYLDFKENLLTADDLVQITDPERTITGRNFVFYFEDEQGELENYYLVEEVETGEQIILKGKKAEFNGDELRCKDSSFTGCNRETPHYHLTADRMEYYPDDRVEFYKASYWEGKVKILTLPKIVFSIKEQENDFDESTFGYNNDDGFFLKMVYRYALNDRHQGKLLFDLIQAKGVGEGIKHFFPVGTDKNFALSFYHLDNLRTNHQDCQFLTDWKQETGPLSYTLGANLNDLGYPEYRFKGNLNCKDQKWPTTFRFEAGQQGKNPELYLYPCQLNMSWRPTSRNRLDYKTSIYYREDLSSSLVINKKYQHNLEYLQYWDLFSLKNFQILFKIKQEFNYSERYQTPYYHELPSLSLKTPDINLGFPGYYQGNLDYLRLIEVRGEQEKEGYRTELLIQRRPLGKKLWQAGGFALDLAHTHRLQYYQVDAGTFRREAISFGLTGTEKFTPRLTWTNTLSWVEAEGTAPTVEFPRLVTNSYLFSTGGHMTSRLGYNSKILTANLAGGYNLSRKDNPWYPVQFVTALNIDQNNSLRFNASYNPNIQQYTHLYLTAKGRYQSEKDNHLYLDLYYDFLQKKWLTLELEAKLKQDLTKNVRADINVRYSFFGDGLEKARLGLNYNWHCRDLFFGYDLNRKEYILQFSYKVFKEAGFGYGSGEQGFIWTGADTWGNQSEIW